MVKNVILALTAGLFLRIVPSAVAAESPAGVFEDTATVRAVTLDPGVRDALRKLVDARFPDFGFGSQAPSAAQIARTSVELPFVDAAAEIRRGCAHVIVWDHPSVGPGDAYFEPLWRKQSEALQAKLTAAGVDPRRIYVHEVRKTDDFMEAVRAHLGSKTVYVFGHASPLVIHFGKDRIQLAAQLKELRSEGVQVVCHFGCSFIPEGDAPLRDLQKDLRAEEKLTLYGHLKPSDETDDSPWDLENPIVRCEVGGGCVRRFDARKDAMEALKKSVERLAAQKIFFAH